MADTAGPFEALLSLLAGGDLDAACTLVQSQPPRSLPPSSLNALGRALGHAGRTGDALDLLRRTVAEYPDFGPAHFNLARILKRQGALGEALQHARRSAESQPEHVPSWNNLANLLAGAGDSTGADAAWARALELDPSQGTVWLNRARQAELDGDTARTMEFALAAIPHLLGDARSLDGAARLIASVGGAEQAMLLLRELAARNPAVAPVHLELAMLLHRSGQYREALATYRAAAKADRACAAAYLNAGVIHHLIFHDLEPAERCFRRAMELAPRSPDPKLRLARLLEDKRDVEGALALAREAVDTGRSALEARSLKAHLDGRVCDWSHYAQDRLFLPRAFASADTTELPPLDLNFLGVDGASLSDAARGYVRHITSRAREIPPLAPRATRGQHRRVRVGYLSQDLRHHAVGQLFHRALVEHDRSRVEVFVYSLLEASDAIQGAVRSSAEHFLDADTMDSRAIADRIAGDEIDVLVDLGGFTAGARPEVLVLRPAPIQLLHLGYLTTTAAPWYDGIIADDTIAVPEVRAHFTETLHALPGGFAVASPLPMRETPFTRADFGLPPDRTVLCCMSRPLKIDPDTFSAWMEILRRADDAILWLFDDELPRCRRNLQQAARDHGIDPARLYFAPQLRHPDYLASYGVADLFLDTFHYNACATAVGALLAGLPVLSCLGSTFLARAGGSIVRAAGTPSLAVNSRADYVDRAVDLVSNPGERAALREIVLSRRGPLFDTRGHAAGLEEVYSGLLRSGHFR